MIKKYLLALVVLLGCGYGAEASHISGMEIWYEYTGTGNVYRVYLNQSLECAVTSTSYASIAFQSASTGQSFSRILSPQLPFDSSAVVYCPTVTAGCNTPYPIFHTAHFSDTVTLSPANDWKISCTDGSRSGGIMNLQNPSS